MMVVLILPLKVVAGQSCGQVIAFSFPPQIPSPQRDASNSPGVPIEAGWLQEARMNKQLKVRIRKLLMVVLNVRTTAQSCGFCREVVISEWQIFIVA
jgi:hypothetical protein